MRRILVLVQYLYFRTLIKNYKNEIKNLYYNINLMSFIIPHPTRPTTENLDEWKLYIQELCDYVNVMKKNIDMEEKLLVGISKIKHYFDKHVPTSKTFDEKKVVFQTRTGDYIYNHDGVSIKYRGVERWVLGDLDYFDDVTVKIYRMLVYSHRD